MHSLLRQHGVTAVSKVSKCLKAGILHGFVKLVSPEEDPEREFGLDQFKSGELYLELARPVKIAHRATVEQ